MQNLYIPIIIGTHHDNSQSYKIAKHVLRVVKESGIETELVVAGSPELWKSGDGGEFGKIWRDKALRADAYVIVSPEYNHGYPGELKLMLDTAFKEYNKKPAGIVGVSNGPIGGARMLEQLRTVLVTMKIVPITAAVYVKNVDELLDEAGNFVKENDVEKNTKSMLDELIWYTEVLKNARDKR